MTAAPASTRPAPSARLWPRRLGAVLLAGLGLSLFGWRIGIRVIERAPPRPAGADSIVRCAGAFDPAWAGAADRARRHLLAMRIDRRIPGLAAAAAVRGRIVWSEGVGLADRERGVPACPATRFRLQSVSKLLTTAAMARLAQRGALDLDAPVARYVPGLPPALGAVTARQLASHRAGVRHYRDDAETLMTTRYETATASLERFRDDSLLFAPDRGSSYSSYAFVLLGAELERAAGLAFPALLQREVLEPFDLRRTSVERRDVVEPGQSAFYDNVTPYSMDGRVRPSPALDVSGKWPAGGMLATVEDLVRFGTAHIRPFNGGLLADSTLAELFTARTRSALVFGQGLGWVAGRDHRGRQIRLHFGAGSGGTSFLVIYPDQQAAVAVLANLGHAGFPVPRLLGVIQPFVDDPAEPVVWLLATVLLAGSGMLWRRRGGPAAAAFRDGT